MEVKKRRKRVVTGLPLAMFVVTTQIGTLTTGEVWAQGQPMPEIASVECKDRTSGVSVGKVSGVVISSTGYLITVADVMDKRPNAELICSVQLGTSQSGSGKPLTFRGVIGADIVFFQITDATDRPYQHMRYCALTEAHRGQPLSAFGFPSNGSGLSVRQGTLATHFPDGDSMLETDIMTTKGMGGAAVVLTGTNSLVGVVIGQKFDADGNPSFAAIRPVAIDGQAISDHLQAASDQSACSIVGSRRELERRLDALEALETRIATLENLDQALTIMNILDETDVRTLKDRLPGLQHLADHDIKLIKRFADAMPEIINAMESSSRSPEKLDERITLVEQVMEWSIEESAPGYYNLVYDKMVKTDIHVETIVELSFRVPLLVKEKAASVNLKSVVTDVTFVVEREDRGAIIIGPIVKYIMDATRDEIIDLKRRNFSDEDIRLESIWVTVDIKYTFKNYPDREVDEIFTFELEALKELFND